MNSVQLLEILESIDIMAADMEHIEENKYRIIKHLDSLRLEFDLDLEKEKVLAREKNNRLREFGYESMQSIVRINSLLNIFKIYLDVDILSKLENKYKDIQGEMRLSIDLLKYNDVNIRILMHNEDGNYNVSNENIKNYRDEFIDYMIKNLKDVKVKDDESLSFIEVNLNTDYVLEFIQGKLQGEDGSQVDKMIFGIVKYFDKLIEIRIAEEEFENDFIPFLSIFDLGYRYLMGEKDPEVREILVEYLRIIRNRALVYLDDTKTNKKLLKDIDDFISYIDTIYDKDYTELKIGNNYPSVILKFEEEKDSVFGSEIVEFYL